MSNIRDVARLAGVSVATVSRALSNPEKVSPESLEKVHTAIAEVGYRPNMLARNFRSARAYAVVVLVPDIANPFYSLFIRALEDRAHQKGYAVLLGDTRGTPERELEYIRRVETRLADGIVQLRPSSEKSQNNIPPDVPCVNACGCEYTTGPAIRIDNRAAARSMVEYLISLGHRRIGVISGLKDNPHAIDRLEGYKEALASAGIAFEKDLIAEGDFTMWSGLNAAFQFCNMKNRPTAIFSMNDEMAIGAMQTLKNQGIRIPEDMSVTGFDDIAYAKYSDPSLTTISQPAEEMGKMAMDMLLKVIEGEPLSQRECVLPTEFIIRKSTGPVPKH
ncbi:LacI family DNA-binding transcriptional regulator [Cellvibrio japonicus]|uniref:Transcriptional regulator n=1 Tax=Cellvibrio japonicus (strain Ueda107) TaxID=498211 RepID=B3PGI5_CELJU|nr:LacI family DNA-binding transcriptional regulator [Cellvibrio japonicus]ACE84104.1 Transcriptional regulator [Cellvibrio japonicus Ueda107]QEI10970.1 LacI family transcriptional regulator [Cellvibrio japonicus]QEI14546.1 LacI family transcriptional regulator [Cellvibrio japonicus]QEI18124.1 LacI family transcriptional regulator [Cellvibrio japonicus]